MLNAKKQEDSKIGSLMKLNGTQIYRVQTFR